MADAVAWQILEAVRDDLRNNVTFAVMGSDTTRQIPTTHILIRKLGDHRNMERGFQNEKTPGILISPVRAVRDPERGTNNRDDAEYIFLIQVIDADNHDRQTNLRTYLKWQEQIAKRLNSDTLSTVQTSDGYVDRTFVIQTDNLDERQWKSSRMMVAALIVHFTSREPRD